MPRPPTSPERVARAKRLGVSLRSLREQRGMSRERLARLADVSSDTVRKIERGLTTPELFTFAALAEQLGVSIDEVVAEVRRNEHE